MISSKRFPYIIIPAESLILLFSGLKKECRFHQMTLPASVRKSIQVRKNPCFSKIDPYHPEMPADHEARHPSEAPYTYPARFQFQQIQFADMDSQLYTSKQQERCCHFPVIRSKFCDTLWGTREMPFLLKFFWTLIYFLLILDISFLHWKKASLNLGKPLST